MKKIGSFNKAIRNLTNKRVIKWIIIPLGLVLLWLAASLFYNSYSSFTVLEFSHGREVFTDYDNSRLYRGNKLTGEFTARENNLGIVAIRFRNVPKVEFEDEDTLVFRIKEKGGNIWASENYFKSGIFANNQFSPFGFEVQSNSRGKIYEFELLSLKGNAHNAVFIKNGNQNFISKYKFEKEEIFKNINSVLIFSVLKFLSFITNYNLLLNSLFFLLPLLIYLLMALLSFERLVKRIRLFNFKKIVAPSVCIIILLDIAFSETINNGFVFGMLGLWIFSVYINKFSSKASYIFSSVLLILSLIVIYFNLPLSINKITTFAYLLLVIGFIYTFLELRRDLKNRR